MICVDFLSCPDYNWFHMKKLFELINKNLESMHILHSFQKKNGPSLPIITISREKGSAGRPIAYLVAKKLGKPWQVYHKDIVEQIAQETSLEKELVEQIDESNIPFITQLLDQMFGKKYISLNNYYKHLLRILVTIGNRGFAVIVGRGANFLFPHALKVRIIASMQTRVEWMMKYERISQKEALKRIAESDENRINFAKTLFQHDQRKAHHYDIVIRSGTDIGVEEATDIIISLAKKKFNL